MDRNTLNVDASQEVPTTEPTIDVLSFTDSTKPGSSYVGHATVEVHNLIPGFVIGLAKVGLFAPFDPQDEEEKGKCRFSNFKNSEDKWEPSVWFRAEALTADGKQDRQLNYKLLGRIRKAVEAYRTTQENPNASFDALPQDVPVSDEDIPF